MLMRTLTIEHEDGNIIINVDDDGTTTHCADLAKLDEDLLSIANNRTLLIENTNENWDDVEFGRFIENCEK